MAWQGHSWLKKTVVGPPNLLMMMMITQTLLMCLVRVGKRKLHSMLRKKEKRRYCSNY